MTPRPTRRRPSALRPTAVTLSLSLLAAFSAGCTEPRHVVGADGRIAAPKPKAQPEDTFIVGKRTQEIVRADAPAAKKGAVVATQKITAKDPITLSGNAYVTMIGQTSILNIKHAMDLYQAANDRYPANYEEFMKEIIQANNIALPKLPYYQKYAYDEKEHKLLVYEYPDLKAGPMPGAADK
jgi:hypothetical protein